MDFKLPNNVEQLRVKTRKFVDDNIIPLESETSSKIISINRMLPSSSASDSVILSTKTETNRQANEKSKMEKAFSSNE